MYDQQDTKNKKKVNIADISVDIEFNEKPKTKQPKYDPDDFGFL